MPFILKDEFCVQGKQIPLKGEQSSEVGGGPSTQPSNESFFDLDPPVRKRRVKKMSRIGNGKLESPGYLDFTRHMSAHTDSDAQQFQIINSDEEMEGEEEEAFLK